MAKNTTPAPAEEQTTAIAASAAAPPPAPFSVADMEADAGLTQRFDAAQMIIPRLLLLQDLSPQVKERNAEFVPGARPGLYHNSVTKGLAAEVFFIPAHFVVRYIAWRPRASGGGLVDQSLTLQDVEQNFDQVGIGQWVGRMSPRKGEDAITVEVKETPEWIGLCRSTSWDWMPMAISFVGTKAKAARAMNTEISLMKLQGKNGKFTPPSFYHEYCFTSGLETAGNDEWFGYVVRRTGFATDAEAVAEARQLKIDFEKGAVVVADTDGGLSQDVPV
jgi:hypothetical protein